MDVVATVAVVVIHEFQHLSSLIVVVGKVAVHGVAVVASVVVASIVDRHYFVY